jgi:chemotaxis protein MotB
VKKPDKPAEGGANWMDTYGDMVTLLLCFFVLLYSISTVDQTKWTNLVKSLNPTASELSQIVTDLEATEGTEDLPGTNTIVTDQTFDELYDNILTLMQDAVNEDGANQNPDASDASVSDAEASGEVSDIQISKGDGYQFITFKDNIFFDGDSYELRDTGKAILDKFAEAIATSADSIKEIQVLGHTTQADPEIPNEIVSDRLLSACRSAMVVAYLQEKNIIDPRKLVSAGYGQFRAISPFDTEENRAKNRRVEILITQDGAVEKSLEEYYKSVYGETSQ